MTTAAGALQAVTMRAPAKLNLRLHVLDRRADGFHEIETLLVRLRLADTVSLEPGRPGIALALDRATGAPRSTSVPADSRNLCWKAAEVFYDAVGRDPAVAIRLAKHVPVAAGLGGGSSDAAAVLTGLNEAHDRPLSRAEVIRCAAGLGSDVPFFAAETPAAVATGRGERIRPVEAPPARPVLIIVPDFGVSAADAYAWWGVDAVKADRDRTSAGGAGRGARPSSPADREDLQAAIDWPSTSRRAVNDLSAPVVARRPELGEALDALRAARAMLSILCGSGSCIAGVFETEAERDAARTRLAESRTIDPAWRLIPTATEGPRGL